MVNPETILLLFKGFKELDLGIQREYSLETSLAAQFFQSGRSIGRIRVEHVRACEVDSVVGHTSITGWFRPAPCF